MEYPPFTIPILLSLRSSLAHHLYPEVLYALVLVELGLEVVPDGDLGGAFVQWYLDIRASRLTSFSTYEQKLLFRDASKNSTYE